MKKLLYILALLPGLLSGQLLDNMTGGYIGGTAITAAYQNGVQVWSANTFPLSAANGFVASYWAEDLATGAVASWPDKIGSNNATQGTGANQPSCVNTDSDGKKSVKFDGTNDGLSITEVAALDFAPGDPITIVIVTGEASWGDDQFILHKGNASSSTTGVEYGVYTAGTGGNRFQPNIYGDLGGVLSTKTTSAVDVWIITSSGTGTFDYYKNGTLQDNETIGTANISSNIWIGNRLGSGKYFSGSIRAIGIGEFNIGSTLRAEIDAYDW